jgi:outer membrane protease
MRTRVIVMALLLVSFCLSGSASSGVDVGFSFSTQKMLGHTKFRITFSEFFPEIGSDVKGESELDFPLDVFLVGGSVNFKGNLRSGESWCFNLGAFRNVNHPSGSMKDTDWISLPQYNIRKTFSYTESDAELKALLLCAEGRLALLTKPSFVLQLLVGYEYQKLSFEILGVRGWQGIEPQDVIHFDTLQGVNVLDYEVKYHIPYGGLSAYFEFSPRLSFEAKAVISPSVSAKDHDDHLLRFKTFDGDCRGWAVKAGTDMRWIVFKTSGKSNWFVGLGFDFMKIDADGKQDQMWYGDDPISEEDDTGKRLTGIKEEITSEQTTIRASTGYRF